MQKFSCCVAFIAAEFLIDVVQKQIIDKRHSIHYIGKKGGDGLQQNLSKTIGSIEESCLKNQASIQGLMSKQLGKVPLSSIRFLVNSVLNMYFENDVGNDNDQFNEPFPSIDLIQLQKLQQELFSLAKNEKMPLLNAWVDAKER